MPVIGTLIIYEPLPQAITVKNVTISRQAHRWFISFKIDTKAKITPKETEVVSVDLGVKSFVDRWLTSSKTCSNCGHKKESLSLTQQVFNCEPAR